MVLYQYCMKAVIISFLLLGTFVVATPSVEAKIVSCDGVECNTCHVIKTANNILTFFIEVAIYIAGIMFAWGGLLMVMSGGDRGKFEQGKAKMTDAVIGIIIVLAAWLLVDTVLKLVLSDDVQSKVFGFWNQIQC